MVTISLSYSYQQVDNFGPQMYTFFLSLKAYFRKKVSLKEKKNLDRILTLISSTVYFSPIIHGLKFFVCLLERV